MQNKSITELIKSGSIIAPAIEKIPTEFEIETEAVYKKYYEQASTISLFLKAVESERKKLTRPLDELKKSIIKEESEWTEPYKEALEAIKQRLLKYDLYVYEKEKEANNKLKQAAKEQISNGTPIQDVLESIVQANVVLEKPKNIRTSIKARIIQGRKKSEVDWIAVLKCLFSTGNLEPEELLKNLPKAMKELNVEQISGIELYEVKTQVIR
jgi:hypothetical protein